MNTNNYTIKSQEALQHAVQLAQSKGQQAIETGHLLKGVMNVGHHPVYFQQAGGEWSEPGCGFG